MAGSNYSKGQGDTLILTLAPIGRLPCLLTLLCMQTYHVTMYDAAQIRWLQEVWKDCSCFSKMWLKYNSKQLYKDYKKYQIETSWPVNDNPTHRSAICYEERRKSFCMSVGQCCKLHRKYKGGEVPCPQSPRKPLCIQSLHQGWELDPCGPDIHHLGGHCRCIVLLQSSSTWLGKLSIGLW